MLRTILFLGLLLSAPSAVTIVTSFVFTEQPSRILLLPYHHRGYLLKRRSFHHKPVISVGMSTQQQQQQPDEDATTATTAPKAVVDDAPTMRVADIRAALNELHVDYADCFDKESLVARLQNARAGKIQGKARDQVAVAPPPPPQPPQTQPTATKVNRQQPVIIINREEVLKEVRSLSVKALREELASRRIRWAGLLEKEALVQAVVDSRAAASTFSATGLLTPGQVTDLTGDQLQQEIESSSSSSSAASLGIATPLLVDVYAVWCGPCQLMAGQLKEAAESFGDTVRVVKMDSDKNPARAGQLRVQGLPTLILYSSSGQEVDRIEGALTKDQLVQWVQSKL